MRFVRLRREDHAAVDHDQHRPVRVKVDEVVKYGKDLLPDFATALPAEDARFQTVNPQALGREHSLAGVASGIIYQPRSGV